MDKARGPLLGCHFSRASVTGTIGVKSHLKACRQYELAPSSEGGIHDST